MFILVRYEIWVGSFHINQADVLDIRRQISKLNCLKNPSSFWFGYDIKSQILEQKYVRRQPQVPQAVFNRVID